ncbi:anti-sigma factor family protein [Terrihabitans sp. B22-R8]|uniref:anti-sigma factor family protein n=1 Tax=Terrihabitans sp. B22-R8 TaxID=3425128 RepID=UPI00403C06F9
MAVDRVTEAELNAFVDGQIDDKGRLEVQEFLSRNPDVAARVMADLSLRDSLRLSLPAPISPPMPGTVSAARRLSQALRLRRFMAPASRIAAGLGIFLLGWGTGIGWDRAQESRRAEAIVQEAPATSTAPVPTVLAAAPVTAPSVNASSSNGIIDASHLDPAKLGAAVSVRLPRIPDSWTLIGTRIVDTSAGIGIEVILDTPEFGELSLLARHTKDVAIVLPTINKVEGESTAHWQLVSDSYALTAHQPRKPLEFAALELFQTLY